MFNRTELKQKGKNAFLSNYWPSVLAAFLISLFATGSTGGTSVYNFNETTGSPGSSSPVHLEDSLLPSSLIIFFIVAGIIAVLLDIFVFNVIQAGGKKYFVLNSKHQAPSIGTIFSLFQNSSYLNVVRIMFFRDLYICLWTLCLIVPGIIKTFEYRMVPYILADNPSLAKDDVFRKSKELMQGNKMSAFVLDLSFLGWDILAAFTFELLAIFFVNPYKEAVNAELYNYLNAPFDHETVNPEVIDNDQAWTDPF